ncbi:MAG TPA: cytochrome P450 [Stenomitos sp.]
MNTHKIPHDSYVPLLGNVQYLFSNPQEYLWNAYNRHGKIFRIKIGPFNTVVLVGPEANEFVLSNKDKIFSNEKGYWFLKNTLGNGILLQDGQEHSETRKFLYPAFTESNIDLYFYNIYESVSNFLNELTNIENFSLYKKAHFLTFNIACKIIFGIDIDASRNLYPIFINYIKSATSISSLLNLNWHGTLYSKSRIAYKEISKYILDSLKSDKITNSSNKKLISIMHSSCKHAANYMDEKFIINTLQILFASRDTTAHMLCWAIYELANHPDYVNTIRNELFAYSPTGSLDLNIIKSLTTLDNFLKEIERLYPPAYILQRGVQQFEYEGYQIPKGWFVNISPFLTHRLEEIYEKPHQFNPNRFCSERLASYPPYSLIGFGGGIHKCIGQYLALLELKTILITLIADFTWKLSPVNFTPIPAFQTFSAISMLRLSIHRNLT